MCHAVVTRNPLNMEKLGARMEIEKSLEICYF
jgi:hypothetical protein